MYSDSRVDPYKSKSVAAGVFITLTNASSVMVNNAYQNVLANGAKPLEGIGGMAAEKEDKDSAVVYFFKSGTSGWVNMMPAKIKTRPRRKHWQSALSVNSNSRRMVAAFRR